MKSKASSRRPAEPQKPAGKEKKAKRLTPAQVRAAWRRAIRGEA